IVHGKECDIEADECQPEAQMTQTFVHHSPGYLRKPIECRAEQWKNSSADQNVVEMSHDKKRVMYLQVERNGSDHDACEPAEHEDCEKAQRKHERRPELRTAAPERHYPAEDLSSAWDSDNHARRGEEARA